MEKQKVSVEDLIEVTLYEDDDFLKIKETLTRIGISSRKENRLYQSCHILHKRGKYYIVHFKELFALDGLPSNFSDEDKARRNTIVNLLDEWELCEIVHPEKTKDPVLSIKQLKIISHKEKQDWELCPKYHIGKKK
tara:strand:- start:1677 stop:2084 length:408 start_codon:yes stop_codon:yes gene_type:complete